MLSQKQAETIANDYLRKLSVEADLELIIFGVPKETSRGYIFSFNSRKWIEEKDIPSAMVGNFPFLVNKVTGDIEDITEDASPSS